MGMEIPAYLFGDLGTASDISSIPRMGASQRPAGERVPSMTKGSAKQKKVGRYKVSNKI
jgi:hypothetical protein